MQPSFLTNMPPEWVRLRQKARENYEQFWYDVAQHSFWFVPPTRHAILETSSENIRWFSGAQTNLSYAALDVHIKRGWGGHTALITANEHGEVVSYTYVQLWQRVRRIARALRALGVKKGDRVGLYMPTIAEAIATMLAVTRIGAIHIVTFAGFGAQALQERLRAAGVKVLIASDITYRRGRAVPLLPIVQEAVSNAQHPLPELQHIVLHTRAKETRWPEDERFIDWETFLSNGSTISPSESSSQHTMAQDEVAWMEANEPAFILATSGTTAKPKLVVHTHGAYQVGVRAMADWVYKLKQTDIWWSTSDIGWIVGHSFIVYGPLLKGATTVAFEGALDYPSPETFYRLLDEQGIHALFVSPTLVRMLMKYGSDAAKHYTFDALDRVFSAGEALNPPAWRWFSEEILNGHVPVIDHWWQTETGAPVIAYPYGLGWVPLKPGSAGVPLPGIEIAVVDENGTPLPPGTPGTLVIERPFPTLTTSLWQDAARYKSAYWDVIPGRYYTGDAAMIDEDGYVWFAGRADEVLKIAGHRLGIMEVESAFLTHPAVAEAGVIGKPDPIRGEVIAAFVVLKSDYEPTETLRQELIATVKKTLGPIAVIDTLTFVDILPKTRSGKIMRRILRATLEGRDIGDVSTIEDTTSVDAVQTAWHQQHNQTD
ncbi:MAG: Acetyl-coenzyme A synthetase [Candidatus Carbobacillus altaicus]|uniref:Acetyl-coenzyme A synthetase n=1 Tax=Candidatus Carbonibacillus altaicus TaxID=2163959 RepID=A0A2R6Y5D2_9BACL|nr:MAG: Acetyl-coenzyme A synthetase [Candidatus Carbobacillus altaicus]